MVFHPSLVAGRWQTMSLAEQFGNIGSEVSRALSWSSRGQAEYARLATERALELFDLTLDDPRWAGRRREVARAREVTCDLLLGENQYQSDKNGLMTYFDTFALAVRSRV